MIHPNFYRFAGTCSVISAATTLMLIFLPYFWGQTEGFEARMQRVHDPAYVLRSYVYLLHPFLVLTAALGIALQLRRRAPVLALFGALGFVLWAFTEAGQQTLTLFAFDKWRLAYAAADAQTRASIRTATMIYDGLWDGMYFLLLLGFAIGNLLYGLALLGGERFDRVVGLFFLGGFAVTFTYISGELRWFTLSGPVTDWIYPAIQPLGRVLIGVWLWHMSQRDPAAVSPSLTSKG